MKRLLLPAALAMLCASGAAMAQTVSISFDGLCDGMDIILDKSGRTALETGNGCDVGAHFGAGTIGKIRARGNTVTFGVNLGGKGGSAYQYIYVIDYPFVTGGCWTNFYTTDGLTRSVVAVGTYTVGAAPRKTDGLRSSTDMR
jgi:opacity protein-like surface antigen